MRPGSSCDYTKDKYGRLIGPDKFCLFFPKCCTLCTGLRPGPHTAKSDFESCPEHNKHLYKEIPFFVQDRRTVSLSIKGAIETRVNISGLWWTTVNISGLWWTTGVP